LVPVSGGLIEQDQDGRSHVTSAKTLTSARETASEHLIASAERASAVSAGASAASATASARTTVAFGTLTVLVFVKFVIHSFLL
jgi:hypothetical protein